MDFFDSWQESFVAIDLGPEMPDLFLARFTFFVNIPLFPTAKLSEKKYAFVRYAQNERLFVDVGMAFDVRVIRELCVI